MKPCINVLLATMLTAALPFRTVTAGIGNVPSQKCFIITEQGSVGDGKTLNTKAIQAAIERCAAGGGGTLVVPEGTFVTGSIFLKQGVNLQVEKGGVLKGSQNTNDYPWIATRIAGLEMKWPAALV